MRIAWQRQRLASKLHCAIAQADQGLLYAKQLQQKERENKQREKEADE